MEAAIIKSAEHGNILLFAVLALYVIFSKLIPVIYRVYVKKQESQATTLNRISENLDSLSHIDQKITSLSTSVNVRLQSLEGQITEMKNQQEWRLTQLENELKNMKERCLFEKLLRQELQEPN